MIFSLLVAFVITPWAAQRFLAEHTGHEEGETESRSTRLYRWFMGSSSHQDRNQWVFLGIVTLLLIGAVTMVYFKLVVVKMLPFDNRASSR